MAREILIADGNKAAHRAFEEIFKETDYNLIFSENGEDALLKMKLFKPVLVIADVTMPDKNGKELCQVLKGDPDLNKVPFVLLGGPFDEDIEEEKQQVRADGTITKPLQRQAILKLVDGLLMAELADGTRGADEEILELQPMAGGTESASFQEEEEIIDLLDVIEGPVARPEEISPETPGEAMKSSEIGESEEAGPEEDKAIADLGLPEDMGFGKADEEIQSVEIEGLTPGAETPEEVDLKTEPVEVDAKISPEEGMGEARGIEEEYPGPMEERSEPELEALGAEEVTVEIPTEEMGELPQDVMMEKSLEEALTEQLEELPVEGTSEPEPEALGAEEVTVEIPTEGMGELPQDVLREKGLEEALSEEIEELPEDLLGDKTPEETLGEWEDTPGKGGTELGGLEELVEETEAVGEEEGVLEEASTELPGEGLEEGELEKLSSGDIATDEFEWQPPETSQEMDVEDLAEKVLKEEDLYVFGEEGRKEEGLAGFKEAEMEGFKEEGLEGFHEEVFREGELEKLVEEATRDQEEGEIAGGALAEAIEEFTGEAVREGGKRGVEPSQERRVQETISTAIKEVVEGLSAKVLPQLTEAISAAVAERIEKTVQKIVPAMAEEAIQQEIRRLEKIKKEEDFDT